MRYEIILTDEENKVILMTNQYKSLQDAKGVYYLTLGYYFQHKTFNHIKIVLLDNDKDEVLYGKEFKIGDK